MAFDGIIANMITNELKCSLINGKVNKIFEPNRNEILIGIYSNAKNYMLNILNIKEVIIILLSMDLKYKEINL